MSRCAENGAHCDRADQHKSQELPAVIDPGSTDGAEKIQASVRIFSLCARENRRI
jgi:hypothetical protein